MSDSIQTPIYKIRSSIAIIDSVGKLQKVDLDFSYLEKELAIKGYAVQKLSRVTDTKHEYKLFYKKWNSDIKWKEFIAEIAEPNEDILKHNISINEGFILLVKIKKVKSIYAITGGFGHTELQSFINYQFGLDILSRLITTTDKVLKAAKERNFVGGVLGSVKYFRGDYDLNENESFGNYYQELRAKLDKDLLKTVFSFTDDELKRGGLCDAKSSFTIRKPVSFERAIHIIDALDKLQKTTPIVDLNLIKKLDKSDKALVEKLDKEVETELYKIFKSSKSDINFEVCHKYFDKYYDAVEFVLTFTSNRKSESRELESCITFSEIIFAYKEEGIVIGDQSEFNTLIESTRISSLDEKGGVLTNGKVIDHLCAELKYKTKSYFLFNQDWYLIKPDFVSVLNKQCQEHINGKEIKNLLQKWNSSSESENAFNAKHIGDTNTLVFDKVLPDNIEVCDILIWNISEIFFVHVKKGFDNEMRNLGRQVHIAARRINDDIRTGKTFLGNLYDELANKITKDPYFLKAQGALKRYSKKQFLELFNSRKPVFVFAVLDESTKGKRSFSDITAFDSNIAKFCLNQLSQEMRLLDVELRILEIQR